MLSDKFYNKQLDFAVLDALKNQCVPTPEKPILIGDLVDELLSKNQSKVTQTERSNLKHRVYRSIRFLVAAKKIEVDKVPDTARNVTILKITSCLD